jgi:hypothetical protein
VVIKRKGKFKPRIHCEILTAQARIQAMTVKKIAHKKKTAKHMYVSTAANAAAPDA